MTREEAMDKIRKLLALSKSTNENESQMALVRAHRLMSKWDITVVETAEDTIEHISQECTGGRSKKWVQILSFIIADNFRCKVYFNENKTCFYGRESDVEAAAMAYNYAYKFIARESGRRYREAVEWHGSGAGIVNSYAFGFLKGLKEVLEAQSMALMVVIPKDVTESFNDFTSGYHHVKTRKVNPHVNGRIYNEGYHDGRTSQTRRIE